MQGRHIYRPSSAIVDMESLVPSNHFLRRVDRVIDLSFIRELTQRFYCEGKGRPSIDPELFFRLVLVGYFYNIKSDRQLCEEVQYNLAYRLFCKIPLNEEVPDHSSLSRIRDRLGGEVFEQFFRKLVKLCEEHGLVKGKSLMTDATLIEANASIDSMKPRDGQGEEEPHKGNGLNPPKSRKLSNKTHQSATDPDASLAFKEGTPRSLKYKDHVTIDTDKRVIVDAYITTGAAHESQDYIKRIEHIRSMFKWDIEEVIADRAYGSGDNLQTLKDKGIKTYIPLFSGRSGTASLEGFVYESENDYYRCPAGKTLGFRSYDCLRRKIYRASAEDCKNCSMKNSAASDRVSKELKLLAFCF
jgi:transposase